MWDQNEYLRAVNYAATVHKDQRVPGKPYSYVVHFTQVAQEVMAAVCPNGLLKMNCTLAVQCALLHDVMEDVDVTYEEIEKLFGEEVAEGVLALTKNTALPKNVRMKDCIHRILRQPKEIWMVKMADRIVNLQEPPDFWTDEKIMSYKEESKYIYKMLKESNEVLANRLKEQIENYPPNKKGMNALIDTSGGYNNIANALKE